MSNRVLRKPVALAIGAALQQERLRPRTVLGVLFTVAGVVLILLR